MQRLTSLDAFRGATIALMILVNNPGDGRHVYAPLEHSAWDGWTLTDTVFPSFAWIIGVAITLALQKRMDAGTPRRTLFPQILKRAAIIFALGLLIYAFPDFDLSTLRILGVLQRLAICYFVCSVLFLTTPVRGQIAWLVALLGVYWLIMKFAPVPGVGAGYLDVERNFAHYIDHLVLGSHNYAQTKTWDPEGIVSTLPAIATTLLGLMAGHILRLKRDLAERTTWLYLAGSLLLAAGLICDQWLPINKKLWTTSFALFMAGLDFVVFASLLWIVDGLGWKRWARPLVILGMNAIAVYMASEILIQVLDMMGWREAIFHSVFAPLASQVNASLLFAIAYTVLMFGIAYGMYRKGWFLRV